MSIGKAGRASFPSERFLILLKNSSKQAETELAVNEDEMEEWTLSSPGRVSQEERNFFLFFGKNVSPGIARKGEKPFGGNKKVARKVLAIRGRRHRAWRAYKFFVRNAPVCTPERDESGRFPLTRRVADGQHSLSLSLRERRIEQKKPGIGEGNGARSRITAKIAIETITRLTNQGQLRKIHWQRKICITCRETGHPNS